MNVDTDRRAQRRAAALAQPNAKERSNGAVKFACPACLTGGYDYQKDNAVYFPDTDKWSCAWAHDTVLGRSHWDAIGLALGALDHHSGNGNSSTPAPAAASHPTPEAEPWPTPEPVRADLPPVPGFDMDRMLPAAFTGWIADIAARSQCPVDFVAVGAVVTLASIVGRSVTIRPKQRDNWAVVANLWGVAIGRPGIMKSPALNEAIKPVQRLVAEAHATYLEKLKAYEFAEVKAEAHKSVLKERLKKLVRDGVDVDALQAEFEHLEQEPPTERRYLVNDSTVEKLGELLNENPRGLLLFRDELSGFLNTMDREGHENDRAFYSESWNGTGAYTYDRIGRGTVRIEAACLSILGSVQPGPLHAYLREVFGAGATDDGLIQRFQLMVYPDVTTTWQNVDRWPDTDAKTMAFELFRQLAHLDPVDFGAHRDHQEDIPHFRFTPEAQARFDGWRTTLEAKLRDAGEHPVVVSHLAKYRSLMPSLSLLFHLVDCVANGSGGPVSDAAAERAIVWCAYLEAHARRVYQSLTAGPQIAAGVIATKIKRGELPTPFLARQIRRKGWAGLTTPDEIYAGLEILEDLHWIRRAEGRPTGKGGRPTVQYHINPMVVVGVGVGL